MEKEQVKEWAEAQKITVSVDLVEAAKTHMKFLAAVNYRNRFLFEDDTLQRAVYRYNAFWLPLLAKHLKSPVSEEPLVVPLDCELIWHCHRLNPIQYKIDCQRLYGRILTNHKVISSIQTTSKSSTEAIWNKMYPDEPYELDLLRPFSEDVMKNRSENDKFTNYDLIAAVKRQMNFTYQACRPSMSDDLFLQEALCRYKGFLHIIRSNRKTNQQRFSVPTYDIDLMWHTHQLYPDSYCKDTIELVGSVVQHNDSDPDKSKGSKLDIGYQETTKQWQQMFGSSYWKAGAMYKGQIPTPVTQAPYKSNLKASELDSSDKYSSLPQLPTVNAVEVILEFLDIKNLPEEKKENLVVGISKKNEVDKVFNTKRWLGISSASTDKMFAMFQCEPTGEFLFELMSYSPTSDELKPNNSMKMLGSCSLPFGELVASPSQLSINKWISVDLGSDIENSEPVLLHVLMSFSPPTLAPRLFQLVQCSTTKTDQIHAHVVDSFGKIVFTLQKRNIIKEETKCTSDLLTEVYCIKDSGEKHALVEFDGNCWSFNGTHGSFKLRDSSVKDDSLLELVGYEMVKLFPGRRLDFESNNADDTISEQDFTSVIGFSEDYPYGRAIALINSKLGMIKAVDESIVLPGIALAFILSDIPKGEVMTDFNALGEDKAKNEGAQCQGAKCVGRCGGCVDLASDVLSLVNAAGCACGPCKSPQMPSPKNEAFGAQCIGLCTNCGSGWKVAGCACGPCKSPQMPPPKNEAFGAQCIGLCTNCGSGWKAAGCACGPCKSPGLMNDEYGGNFKAAGCACGPCKSPGMMNDEYDAALMTDNAVDIVVSN
ncbi:hypothetical protein RND81_13G180500 [Saponaria officinalis]|uniref:Uncharacterized protein n=1 Tax=Saponaria officinalis TaxID=3572 RepID=A0AAW1H2C1_SAPOF